MLNNNKKDCLIGITTYGSHAYVDLLISSLKRFNLDIVVFDDGSKSEKLQQVCNKHDVLLIGNYNIRQNKRFYGDVRSTISLIRLAHHLNYRLALKISRRFLCLQNPIPSLLETEQKTDASTYSNYTKTFSFGFRTQCWAMRVKEWYSICDKMDKFFDKEDRLFVEYLMHNFARQLQPNSEKYRNYIENYKDCNEVRPDGYAQWDFIGKDRLNNPKHIIWHDQHMPHVYFSVQKLFGLNYPLQDFFGNNGQDFIYPANEIIQKIQPQDLNGNNRVAIIRL